jgi:uncharacterized protein (DUF1501 family)
MTMDRRAFLLRSLALGCSAAASPLMTPVSFASAPFDTRLVVIILRGAMDGLDVIRPVGDRDFAGLRPGLTEDAEALGSGFWARHAGLAPLDPLWASGEMAFVHAVSTPYRDKRSHFDGQDILEAGTVGLDGATTDGWLNRMLQAVPGVQAETAYAIGQEELFILTGAAPVSRWSPETRLTLDPATRSLLELTHARDPLFAPEVQAALRVMDELAEGGGEDGLPNDHRGLALFAADRLRRESRIASFSLGGWDTHAQQARAIARPLRQLSEMILALREGLGPVWGQTAVVCMTEFGRMARQNGAGGTDHGTGGAMILAGGAVRGGQVIADWPGLGEGALYAGRDLMPTRDVRAHAAWVMRGMFGLDTGVLEGAVFPGLDMGTDPGVLA